MSSPPRKRRRRATRYLDLLADELWMHILLYLHPTSIYNVSHTCARFLRLTSQMWFLKKIIVREKDNLLYGSSWMAFLKYIEWSRCWRKIFMSLVIWQECSRCHKPQTKIHSIGDWTLCTGCLHFYKHGEFISEDDAIIRYSIPKSKLEFAIGYTDSDGKRFVSKEFLNFMNLMKR